MLGAYALSAGYYDAYYLKALKVRRLIRQDFDAAFEQVDLIAGPVTAEPAFKIGELSSDPLSMYLVDLYTVSANLAGLPGISLPCGFSSYQAYRLACSSKPSHWPKKPCCVALKCTKTPPTGSRPISA